MDGTYIIPRQWVHCNDEIIAISYRVAINAEVNNFQMVCIMVVTSRLKTGKFAVDETSEIRVPTSALGCNFPKLQMGTDRLLGSLFDCQFVVPCFRFFSHEIFRCLVNKDAQSHPNPSQWTPLLYQSH